MLTYADVCYHAAQLQHSCNILRKSWLQVGAELEYSVEMLSHDAFRECDARVRVRALESRGLPLGLHGMTRDAYLVGRYERLERRTSVVFSSLAPVWHETLLFETSLRDMGSEVQIEVFHYDFSTQYLLIGSCDIYLTGRQL